MTVTEGLELNINAALSNVDRVGTAVQRVAQDFKVSLADALDVLTGVRIGEVDAAPVRAAIEEAVQESEAEPVELDADAEGVTLSIDEAVAGADTVAEVEADTSLAQASLDNLEATVDVEADTSAVDDEVEQTLADIESQSATVDVDVNVDTSAQEEAESLSGALGNLNAAAGAAGAGGLGVLGGALNSVAGLSTISAGDISGVEAAAGKLGGKAGIVAGTVIGLGYATKQFFDAGLEATVAAERFERSLGLLSETVESVDVGSLNGDLSDIAISLGSSDEAVKVASARINDFAKNAGIASKDSARFTEETFALTAAAVAARPEIGGIGENMAGLTAAAARGGRPLAQYGFVLNAAEINARALENSQKGLGDGTSTLSKQIAGVQLLTERYGDTLGETVATGAERADTRVRSLKERIGEFAEEAGKPLIEPIIDQMEALEPIVQSVTRIIGVMVDTGFVKLINIVTGTTGALKVLTVTLEAVADASEAVGRFFTGPEEDADKLARTAGELGDAVFNAATGFDEFGSSVESTQDALNKSNEAFEEWITTSEDSRFVTRNQTDDLNELGISAAQLGTMFDAGTKGADAFTRQLLESGEIGITNASVYNDAGQVVGHFGEAGENTAQQISILAAALGKTEEETLRYLVATEGLLDGNTDLIRSYEEEAAARSEANRLQIEAQVGTGNLSREVADAAIAQNTLQDGTINYAAALRDAGLAQATFASAMTIIEAPLRNNAAGFLAFKEAVVQGRVATQDFELVAAQLGVTSEQVGAFVEAFNANVSSLVSTATGSIPTVTSVFAGMKESTDPAQLIANLAATTASITEFQTNVEALIAGGFTQTAQRLLEIGPEAGGALAKSLVTSTPDVLAETERQSGAMQGAVDSLGNLITERAPGLVSANTNLAVDMSEAFGQNIDFSAVTRDELTNAEQILNDSGLPTQASDEGVQTGEALGAGIAVGLRNEENSIREAARRSVREAAQAAKAEAGIQSPSKLFAGIGGEMSAGMAVGIVAETAQVVAAAESIVRQAAEGASGVVAAAGSLVAPAQSFTGQVAGTGTGSSSVTDNSRGGDTTIQVYEAVDAYATAQVVNARLGLGAKR